VTWVLEKTGTSIYGKRKDERHKKVLFAGGLSANANDCQEKKTNRGWGGKSLDQESLKASEYTGGGSRITSFCWWKPEQQKGGTT